MATLHKLLKVLLCTGFWPREDRLRWRICWPNNNSNISWHLHYSLVFHWGSTSWCQRSILWCLELSPFVHLQSELNQQHLYLDYLQAFHFLIDYLKVVSVQVFLHSVQGFCMNRAQVNQRFVFGVQKKCFPRKYTVQDNVPWSKLKLIFLKEMELSFLWHLNFQLTWNSPSGLTWERMAPYPPGFLVSP